MHRSYRFSHAITRLPSESVVNGLRFDDIGNPNFEQMLLDHEDYSLALREAGAEIIQLPPLQSFPDSTFVEDTVLCLSNLAILMRPGAPSRAGEVSEIESTIKEIFDNVLRIEKPGLIEACLLYTSPSPRDA